MLTYGENWGKAQQRGHDYRCKACKNEYVRVWSKNPKAKKASRITKALYRTTPMGRADTLIHNARRRSKERKMPPPKLSVDDLLPSLERGTCAITGIPFVWKGDGSQHPMAPSLDRPNPKQPYSRDNFRVVLWCVNAGLGTWGLETYLTVASRALGVSFKSTTGVTP